MVCFISLLLAILSLGLLADSLFVKSALYDTLPAWLPTALSLCGLVFSALVLAARKQNKKPKKKQKWPFGVLVISTIACVLSTGYWLYRLILLR